MANLSYIFDNSLYRFVVVGISNTIISYVVFVNCYYFLFVDDASLSQFFSYAAGILWSFYWNRKWTFRSRGGSIRKFVFFLLLQLSMLLLSVYMIHVLVDILDHNPTVSWVLVMGVITVLNYLGNKYWVFR